LRAPDGQSGSLEGAPAAPLSVDGLTVAYNQKPVLWDVGFDLPAGELIAVVGPNGAGKSTLIKAALDLVPRAAGSVRFFGANLSSRRRRIGYVPQRASVDWDFPTTALEVVAMGLYGRIGWLRRVTRTHKRAAMNHLAHMGLEAFADRQIGQLSGGQQQRVFLARALAQDADLYLMDEPFAGVDAATEAAIADTFRTLKAAGKTVLCVHHDLETVPVYFNHVLILNVTLIAQGPVETAFTREALQEAFGGRLSRPDDTPFGAQGGQDG